MKLMELSGRSSPQMLSRYGASARNTRALRTYERVMTDTPTPPRPRSTASPVSPTIQRPEAQVTA